DMLAQLVKILACDLIHGDLSPYNVLWAAAGPTVIDFPQIVSASHNSSSERSRPSAAAFAPPDPAPSTAPPIQRSIAAARPLAVALAIAPPTPALLRW